MKTLILNGSPRKNGDTANLLKMIIPKIKGELKVIDTYYCNINPCIDCRYCRTKSGCSQKDEMQEVYKYIEECDNILIASPIYFSELTGKMLDLGSRLQTYFCARFFRHETPLIKKKKGSVLLVGGGDGNMDKAYDTSKTLLHHMNTYDILPLIYFHNTDNVSIADIDSADSDVSAISTFFNN